MTLAARVEARGQGATIASPETKILVIDLERVPGTAYAWDQKTRFIPAHMWLTRPRTICWAARWYGQKRTMFKAEWLDRDEMVRKSWELYDQADIVVTYNGQRFDNKVFRADWIEAGLPAPKPWKDVDLYKAVQQFAWISKSLDNVSHELDLGGKSDHYSVTLAVAAVNGDREAQKKLRSYNSGDIDATTELYDRLRGYLPGHPAVKTRVDDVELVCNQCGGSNLEREGWHRAVVQEYAAYVCNDCGGHVRSNHVKRVSNVRGVA